LCSNAAQTEKAMELPSKGRKSEIFFQKLLSTMMVSCSVTFALPQRKCFPRQQIRKAPSGSHLGWWFMGQQSIFSHMSHGDQDFELLDMSFCVQLLKHLLNNKLFSFFKCLYISAQLTFTSALRGCTHLLLMLRAQCWPFRRVVPMTMGVLLETVQEAHPWRLACFQSGALQGAGLTRTTIDQPLKANSLFKALAMNQSFKSACR
jgi:hypothetical protein